MTPPELAAAPASTAAPAEALPVDLAPAPAATETAQAESQPLTPPAGSSEVPKKQPASQPERPPSANIYSTEGFSPDVAAPEYLNPDANPLAYPTQPAEVEMAGTQPITIRQAIDLALRNNPTIRQAQFQLERSQADLRRSQVSNLPTLDATGNFTQAGRRKRY